MADPIGGFVGGSEMPNLGGMSGSPSLPSVVSQMNNAVNQLLQTLKQIDSTMTSITQKAGTIGSSLGAGAPGMRSVGTNLTASNGMPMMQQSPNSLLGQMQANQGQPSFSLGAKISGAAIGAAGAMGYASLSQASAQVGSMYTQDILYQRLNSIQGGGQSVGAVFSGLASNLGGGYLSTSDLNKGTANAVVGGFGNMLSGASGQGLAAISKATGGSLNQTTQMEANFQKNPQMIARARSYGIQLQQANGDPGNAFSIINQTLKATWGGRTPTTSELNAALSANGPLMQNLKAEGLSAEEISAWVPALQGWANSGGGDFSKANPAIANAGDAGALSSARGRASSVSQTQAKQFDRLNSGASAANNTVAMAAAAERATGALNSFYGALKGFTGGLGVSGDGSHSAIGSKLGGLANDAIIGSVAHGGVGGLLSRARGVFGGGGTEAGAASGGELEGASMASRLGPIGAIVGTAMAGSAVIDHFTGGIPTALGFAERVFKNDPKGLAAWEAKNGYPNTTGGGLGMGAADAASSSSSSATPSTSYTGGGVAKLLQVAVSMIGTPYAWGGGGTNGPSKGIDQGSNTVGFDCSGFVQYCFAQIGIGVPRFTGSLLNSGQAVKPADAQPGDIIFPGPEQGHHVGIYMGGNKFIDAPYTGVSVRIDPINPSTAFAVRRLVKGGAGGATVATGNSGSGANSSVVGSLMLESNSSAMTGANVLGMNTGGTMGMNTGSSDAGGSTSGGGGAFTPGARTGAGPNEAIVKNMAANQYGWTGNEWNALYDVIMKESGFDNTAQNPNSTAYGIFQFLDATWGAVNAQKTSNPTAQTKAGLAYIKERYGDPEKAWQHEVADHSYDKGAWEIPNDQYARIHKGEMVVPAAIAKNVRKDVSGGGSGANVTINVTLANAGEGEARRLVNMVKNELEKDKHFSAVATA